MDRTRLAAWTLTLAGLIPFAGCAVGLALNTGLDQLLIDLLSVYAAIIVSFLGGARWGAEHARGTPRLRSLVASNLLAVAAWSTFFLPTSLDRLQLLLLAGCTLASWGWDMLEEPAWYRSLRSMATAGAVSCLALAAWWTV